MKKTLIGITSFITFVFFIFITAKYFPDLYKEVKITDYLSSIFALLSFVVAFYAYRYAKDYLKQERHKSASSFAIEILHKDMVLLSSLEKEDTLLYMLSQRVMMYTFSHSKQLDDSCIKHLAKIYKDLLPLIETMRSNIKLVENDIYKAKIVGCTFKDEKNHITEIIDEYVVVKNMMNRNSAVLPAFLASYYGYNYYDIDPNKNIDVELPLNSHMRKEDLKDLTDLYESANGALKNVESKFTALRSGSFDLNKVFNFS